MKPIVKQNSPIASERANPRIAYEKSCCLRDGLRAYPMTRAPKTFPIPAPDPATPTVAAPAPMYLAAESMSLRATVVLIMRAATAFSMRRASGALEAWNTKIENSAGNRFHIILKEIGKVTHEKGAGERESETLAVHGWMKVLYLKQNKNCFFWS